MIYTSCSVICFLNFISCDSFALLYHSLIAAQAGAVNTTIEHGSEYNLAM